jgi:hypothetical protein
MDIQAPDGEAAISAAADAAMSLTQPGGPRQAMTESLLTSPPGYGEHDIDAGFTGDWPNNVTPPGM